MWLTYLNTYNLFSDSPWKTLHLTAVSKLFYLPRVGWEYEVSIKINGTCHGRI